jgi:formylglycine-generating enzyme required for sulfatase activity
LNLGPTDWEAEGVVAPHRITVDTFALDDAEVTWGRYLECAACATLALSVPGGVEPGLPITHVSPEQAANLCAALGGRLPTGDEWVFAAAGIAGRRYPWGATGLVCRRAAFGLAQGPCAWGASLPELAGARPDGATETGLFDLAGNVAEWTKEPDGFSARGGSFSSSLAAQLKSWARTTVTVPALDIGFRCAYDQP